ncbi:MAG: CaiB/BaiF CoA-transferase family protein [Holophagae bacterium]|jgi:crotonobetainyl-CoA:carnitine CoA-transferase CaiB-like acyl-CoA transferase
MSDSLLPLDGVMVVDLSRMLPGAVLARQMLDLGVRLIKIEEPGVGDAMRRVPPITDGVGIGFAAFHRGAESVSVDLRTDRGAGLIKKLAASADVLVESFRPGTLEQWGLADDELRERNPGLVSCSLSSFGSGSDLRDLVAHDLNLSAMAGVLDLVGGRIPRLQLADVTAGLLAASSILAALVARARTGVGRRLEQPLAAGPLPFLTWGWAELGVGGGGVLDTLLGGSCPCYRIYRCGDGAQLSLAALEPKFWLGFVELVGAVELRDAAFAVGEEGVKTAAAVEQALAAHPRDHWLQLARERGLPLAAVNAFDEAPSDSYFAAGGMTEETPLPGGTRASGVGPWNVGLGQTPSRPAPQLGEHTEAIMDEFGIRD